jgi:hypothetical protein
MNKLPMPTQFHFQTLMKLKQAGDFEVISIHSYRLSFCYFC